MTKTGIIPSVRDHKRRGRRAAKQAATLTPEETEALSLYYGGKSLKRIAELMGRGIGGVCSLIRTGELKQPAPRYRSVNREVELAARNWRPVQVGGTEKEPVLRWYPWPFKDTSPDRLAHSQR